MRFYIKIGIADRRNRISWKALRHTDGAKPVMYFEKRQQAISHINHHVFERHVQLVYPNGLREHLRRDNPKYMSMGIHL